VKKKSFGGGGVKLLVSSNQLELIVLPIKIRQGHSVNILNHHSLKLTNVSAKKEFITSTRILGKAIGSSFIAPNHNHRSQVPHLHFFIQHFFNYCVSD